MKHTSESMAKSLLLSRVIEVELFHLHNDWPGLVVEAKVDTGADKSSIDEALADALGWEVDGERYFKNANGRVKRTYGVGPVNIDGAHFLLPVSYADRSDMSHPLLIGHDVLSDLVALAEEE